VTIFNKFVLSRFTSERDFVADQIERYLMTVMTFLIRVICPIGSGFWAEPKENGFYERSQAVNFHETFYFFEGISVTLGGTNQEQFSGIQKNTF
jgi:hypothetical protein